MSCSISLHYKGDSFKEFLLFLNERCVKGETAYEFVFEVASILDPEIDVTAESHFDVDINGHFLYILFLLWFLFIANRHVKHVHRAKICISHVVTTATWLLVKDLMTYQVHALFVSPNGFKICTVHYLNIRFTLAAA